MGMSIPRPSIQMRIVDRDTRLVQVDDHKLDFTDQLNKWFSDNRDRFEQLQGYILKSKSPSCGNLTTPHFKADESFTLKDGLFVMKLKNNHVNIISDDKIKSSIEMSEFKKNLN